MTEPSKLGNEPVLNMVATRFEQSPYYEHYADRDAVFNIYAGRLTPRFLDEDPTERYWALRRSAVLYDVPEKPKGQQTRQVHSQTQPENLCPHQWRVRSWKEPLLFWQCLQEAEW